MPSVTVPMLLIADGRTCGRADYPVSGWMGLISAINKTLVQNSSTQLNDAAAKCGTILDWPATRLEYSISLRETVRRKWHCHCRGSCCRRLEAIGRKGPMGDKKPRLLIIDDEFEIRSVLQEY